MCAPKIAATAMLHVMQDAFTNGTGVNYFQRVPRDPAVSGRGLAETLGLHDMMAIREEFGPWLKRAWEANGMNLTEFAAACAMCEACGGHGERLREK